MAVSLPTFVNNSAPPIDATFLNNISREVELLANRTFDIKDYGAVAGGDAAAAVTTAITAAVSAGGGTIYIPSGDWLWNSVPKLPKNLAKKLHIRGEAGTKVTLTATGLRFLDFDRTADYDTFQNIEISDLLIDVNNLSAPGSNHVVVGMQVAGSETSGQRVNVQKFAVRRVRTINVPVDPTNLRRNIWIISRHLGVGEATQTYLKDITIEDCDFSGGAMGVVIAGTSAGITCNVFIDNITVRGIRHDLLTNPTSNYGSSHVHIGSKGFGGSCVVEDIWGFGSRDVGIEINGMSHAVVDKVDIENTNGFYFVHACYNTPANPGGQQIEVSNLHAVWSGGTHTADASSAIAAIVPAGSAFTLGSMTVRDCSMYKSAPDCNSDGIAIKVAGQMKKLVVDNFEYVDDAINCTVASSLMVGFHLVPAGLTPITLRNIKVRIAGSVTTGTFSGLYVMALYGSAIWDLDNIDIAVNGISTGSTGIRGFNVGAGAGSVIDSGKMNRCRVVIDTSTASQALRFGAASTLTLTENFVVTDCDFSGHTGTSIGFVTGGENQTPVIFRNVLTNNGYYDKGTAAPTALYHVQGEIYTNTAPAAGGNMGWVCVANGTPGTWKQFGEIEV